ncbi:MAG: MBL fold metallo-hydrolase [Oscillospiraceae bacterium]|nr:MBL fold metallo-hydrolase [Oscillospiraceae bacterium]
MDIITIPDMGDFATNAYIVSSGNIAVLIDAPCYPDIIMDRLGELKLEAILLTHGHVDHISAAGELKEKTGCKVYISHEDEPMLRSSKLCRADYFSVPFYPCKGAECFSDGDELIFGDMTFKVVSTKGHTYGSVSFIIDDVIFSGDTLFAGSIGRVDIGGSTFGDIISSIDKLYKLADGKNMRVFSGHGPVTDLYSELIENPYLGALRGQ